MWTLTICMLKQAPRLLHNTQHMPSFCRAAVRRSPATVFYPLPQCSTALAVQTFPRSCLMSFDWCINHFPCFHLNQYLFTDLFYCIRSIRYFHTHTLAHPFMVTQSIPTYWGRSNEQVSTQQPFFCRLWNSKSFSPTNTKLWPGRVHLRYFGVWSY